MASIRDWLKPLQEEDGKGRTVVVHCKAGKGRSGTIACSYLISEEGWTVEDALVRFTQRRMRVGCGNGISIPSQRRWIDYVDQWTKHGKTYVEREIEILEIHAWGVRDPVTIAVEGYVEEGRKIETFYVFDNKTERTSVPPPSAETSATAATSNGTVSEPSAKKPSTSSEEPPQSYIFRPSSAILIPTSDINLKLKRRNKVPYGLSMPTSTAHVWFNCYFEGDGPKRHPLPPLPSGVFTIDWEAMDGIKGSAQKGLNKALDKVSVVWRAKDDGGAQEKVIKEPAQGEEIPQSKAADWAQGDTSTDSFTERFTQMGLKSDVGDGAGDKT